MATAFIDGTFIRTARKSHRCRACHEEIRRGEKYAEYVGEVGVYQSGARYHLGACADGELRDDGRETPELADLLRL